MDHGGPGPYGPHPGMFGPGNHILRISYPCQLHGSSCYVCQL